MLRRSLSVVVTTAAVLATAPSASAAVVRVGNDTLPDAQLEPWDITSTQDPVTVSRLDVVAGRRERLDLRVTVNGSKLVLAARGGRLAARGRCRQAGRRRVRCPRGGLEIARFTLGDRSDRLVLATGTARLRRVGINAGAGDDTIVGPRGDLSVRHNGTVYAAGMSIVGGPGRDRIFGSGGADTITGGPGRDIVHAGRGDDTITDRGADGSTTNDVYDGGPGRDTLVYDRERTRPRDATVDLSSGTAGRPGERDSVANVENATGRSGSDRLVGNDAGNVLHFDGSLARGRGTLMGGAGNDTLVADNPRLVDAGAGDDRVGVTASATDAQVTCGPGTDRVFQSDRQTLLPADCESIELPGEYLSAIEDVSDHTPIVVLIAGTVSTYPVRIVGATATFLLTCAFTRPSDHCKGRLAVNNAVAAFDAGPRQQIAINVPLSSSDAAQLASGLPAIVTLDVAANTSQPPGGDITWRVLLHA